MASAFNQSLISSVLRILRPLVRILLRNGVSYGAFADLAKQVYVDVAEQELGIPGRKQTVSRIAVITGLTRKEVARVQALDMPEDGAATERYNRAARVITGWVRNAQYHDAAGVPFALPFAGETVSFSELVRRYSGDVPPRAILDELLRVGAAEQDDDGRIRLLARAYVPKTGEEDKLHILGTDVAFLIATIDHNLRDGGREPYFQRKVSYDNLPSEIIPEFRSLSRDRAQRLLEELDQWLARYDRDVNPGVQGPGRKQAGVGIYYFEEDVPKGE